MRLKWKVRLYYEALILLLLAILGTATAAVVLHDFQQELESHEAERSVAARHLLRERMAQVDSNVALAARDPELALLARRDVGSTHERTAAEWLPLATRLSQRHHLPLLKILDADGRILASAHWPAVYGLLDTRGLLLALEPGTGARLVHERRAEGDFLALEAPRSLPEPHRYIVIGGVGADSLLQSDLSQRAGVPLRFEMQSDSIGARPFGVTDTAAVTASDSTQTKSEARRSGGELAWLPLPTSPSSSPGGVRLTFESTSLDELKLRLAQIFGLAALAGTLVAWALGVWISARVTRPLEELADGVAVLGTGRTPQPIQVQGSAEVRDLVTSFNRMASSLAESRAQLRRAERVAAWREVAQRVAHEIKNALAPIQLSIENVARSVHMGRGDLNALVDESVSMVRGEVEGLTRLVNAFHEMARLPDPEPRPQALLDTWERAALPFRGQIELQAGGLESLPTLLYDDDQVRRALHNLLRNAQEAGASAVRLQASSAAGGYCVELRDDGCGIQAADLEHIFEPYFTRKNGGSGLGLAIVYKICSDHGWSVAADSPADSAAPAGHGGTVIRLQIPARAASSEEPSHAG